MIQLDQIAYTCTNSETIKRFCKEDSDTGRHRISGLVDSVKKLKM